MHASRPAAHFEARCTLPIRDEIAQESSHRGGALFPEPVDCGPRQTIGGPLENMAKFSEDFAAATSTSAIQQEVAGLTDARPG